jgi:hypothetical protein
MQLHRVFLIFILALIGSIGCGPSKCDPNVPAGVPGSCPILKEEGIEGGPCRLEGEACDGDLRCYKGACWECGGPNQLCCSGPGTQWCPNMVNGDCDNTFDVVEYPICGASCGGIGEACCTNGDPCESVGTCTDGTCESPISASCWTGTALHPWVHVIDGGCKHHSVQIHVNTQAEADSCAQELLDLAETDPTYPAPLEVGVDFNVEPPSEWWCPNPANSFGAKKLFYFSQGQLEACQDFYDASSTSWTQGQCPG